MSVEGIERVLLSWARQNECCNKSDCPEGKCQELRQARSELAGLQRQLAEAQAAHQETMDNAISWDDFNALKQRAEKAEALCSRWKKAIEGLTPSGSEFVDDPEYCAAYIRKRTEYPRQIIELREKLKAAEASLAEAQTNVDASQLTLRKSCEELRQKLDKAEALLAPNPDCPKGHRMADWVVEHEWTGCQQGGDPTEATSLEWVRYCKTCGMEDTCEDPLPPCSGYCRACRELDDAVKDAVERMVEAVKEWADHEKVDIEKAVRLLRESQRQIAVEEEKP